MNRFWSKVNKTPTCWLWTAGVSKNWGYGQFRINNTTVKSHRFSYELYNGKIPKGMLICHKCDTPKCVNPDHLFIGTVHDNNADKIAKGRQSKGSTVPTCILTTKDIFEIKKLYSKRLHTQEEIGKKFGVHNSVISRIVNGKIWKWV